MNELTLCSRLVLLAGCCALALEPGRAASQSSELVAPVLLWDAPQLEYPAGETRAASVSLDLTLDATRAATQCQVDRIRRRSLRRRRARVRGAAALQSGASPGHGSPCTHPISRRLRAAATTRAGARARACSARAARTRTAAATRRSRARRACASLRSASRRGMCLQAVRGAHHPRHERRCAARGRDPARRGTPGRRSTAC